MRYFVIMTGLRGCYMPDSAYCIAVNTRRELKAALVEEYDRQTESGYSVREMRARGEYVASKREIAAVAAALWRRKATDRDSYLSTVIPYGPNGSSGVQVNPATRAEYLESQNDSDA